MTTATSKTEQQAARLAELTASYEAIKTATKQTGDDWSAYLVSDECHEKAALEGMLKADRLDALASRLEYQAGKGDTDAGTAASAVQAQARNIRQHAEKSIAQLDSNSGYGQARAQMSSIFAMVAALECDYDRLEALKDEHESVTDAVESAETAGRGIRKAKSALKEWMQGNSEELQELTEAAGDCESRDCANERIQEDALSIEVRSGWTSPGAEMEAEEFTILLCTGGPAVRIVGELDQYKQPCRAWLEYQDWFTPWSEYHGANADQDTLLTYCQCFYFGE